MSNIYTIFAVVRCILINCIVFYRCNGSNNLLKSNYMYQKQKKLMAGIAIIITIWPFVTCANCMLMFLIIMLLLFYILIM